MEIPTGIIGLVIGLFLLFFGYRLKKIAITVIWFLIGFWLVSLFVDKIVADEMWQLILCGVGGLVLGMFGMTIEKIAVFASVGFAFFMSAMNAFGPATDWTLPVICVAIGVVAGVIAVWFIKPMVIIATSIQGAQLTLTNALLLLNIAQPQWYLIAYVAIILIGGIFQWNNCKNIE